MLWARSCSQEDLRNTSTGRNHTHPTSTYLGCVRLPLLDTPADVSVQELIPSSFTWV